MTNGETGKKRKANRWTGQALSVLLARHRGGTSAKALADELGVTTSQIHACLRRGKMREEWRKKERPVRVLQMPASDVGWPDGKVIVQGVKRGQMVTCTGDTPAEAFRAWEAS